MDLFLATFLYFAHFGLAVGSQLTLAPHTLNLTDSRQTLALEVTCSPGDDVRPGSVLSLSLQRVRLQASDSELLGGVRRNGTATNTTYNPKLAGVVISGDVVARQPMRVTLSRAGCADAGLYACMAAYTSSDGRRVLLSDSSRFLNVTAGATPVEMTLVPEAEAYPAGTRLRMSCRQGLGTGFSPETQQVKWEWHFKNADQSDWSLHPAPSLSSKNLTWTGCEMEAASSLTRDVTVDDAGRVYRCSLNVTTASASGSVTLDRSDSASLSLSVETGPNNTLTISAPSILELAGSKVTRICSMLTDLPDPALPYPLTLTVPDNVTELTVMNREPEAQSAFTRYSTHVTFALAARHHGLLLTCTARFGQYVITTEAVPLYVSRQPDLRLTGPQLLETTTSATWTCDATGASEAPARVSWVYPDVGVTGDPATARVSSFATQHGLTLYNTSSELSLYLPLLSSSFILTCHATHAPTSWSQIRTFPVTVIDKDDCVGRCQHGATCKDHINGFTCVCTRGYTGKTCEYAFPVMETITGPSVIEAATLNAWACTVTGAADTSATLSWTAPPGEPDARSATDVSNSISNYARGTQRLYNTSSELSLYLPLLSPSFTLTCHATHAPTSWSQTRTFPVTVIDKNDCVGQCLHAAVCKDHIAGFTCVCAEGYTGQLCEYAFPEMESIAGPRVIESATNNSWTCAVSGAPETPPTLSWAYLQGEDGVVAALKTDFSNYTADTSNLYNTSSELSLYLPLLSPSFTLTCRATHALTGWSQKRNLLVTVVDKNDCVGQCQNGAPCEDKVGDFQCLCPLGYTGRTCESEIDDCVNNQCENGATCEDKPVGYRCLCPAGYTGQLCETDLDECASAPCGNGGLCEDSLNTYNCTCALGFVGARCETDFDDCGLANPCENGGTCLDLVAGYECLCVSGYAGVHCELDFDECSCRPCQNGASCRNLFNDYYCACPDGFVGRNCESDLEECESSPCENGGQCTDTVNAYYCTCRQGFQGVHCQIDIRIYLGISVEPLLSSTSHVVASITCCRPPDVDFGQLVELSILRTLKTDSHQNQQNVLAQLLQDGGISSVRDKAHLAGGRARLNPNGQCLVYSWLATCRDDGRYTCRALYGQPATRRKETSEELVVLSQPGKVVTDILQPVSGPFVENQEVILKCNQTFPLAYKGEWRWEVRRNGRSTWRRYSPARNIAVYPAVRVGACRLQQTSVLRHVIRRPQDQGARLRCYLFRDGVGMGPRGEFALGEIVGADSSINASATKMLVDENKTEGKFSGKSIWRALGMYAFFLLGVAFMMLIGNFLAPRANRAQRQEEHQNLEKGGQTRRRKLRR